MRYEFNCFGLPWQDVERITGSSSVKLVLWSMSFFRRAGKTKESTSVLLCGVSYWLLIGCSSAIQTIRPRPSWLTHEVTVVGMVWMTVVLTDEISFPHWSRKWRDSLLIGRHSLPVRTQTRWYHHCASRVLSLIEVNQRMCLRVEALDKRPGRVYFV